MALLAGVRGFQPLAECGFELSIPRKNLAAKGSLTGLAAERRQMLTSEDLVHDDRIDPEVRAALAANAYTWGACAPLIHDGEVLGSLNLVYPNGTAIGTHERWLVGGSVPDRPILRPAPAPPSLRLLRVPVRSGPGPGPFVEASRAWPAEGPGGGAERSARGSRVRPRGWGSQAPNHKM